MKNLIAYRKPNKMATVLTLIISLTFMTIWLPFLRSIFDGTSYVWGTTFYGFVFQGAGVTVDFIYVIILLLFYLGLFFSAYWVENRMWYYGLLVIWFLIVFGNQISEIILYGDTMFHGDTLNVHVSFSRIVIPLSAMAGILIYLVIKGDRTAKKEQIYWNWKNRNLFLIILGPLPIRGVLFAIGDPDGLTDQIGVVMAILQSFLMPLIIRPKVLAYNAVLAN